MTALGSCSDHEFEQSSAYRAECALRTWYASVGSPLVRHFEWSEYDDMIASVEASQDWPTRRKFSYSQPVRLQDDQYGVGRPYEVSVNYSDAGADGVPVVAIGGLINVVQRFDFMLLDAIPQVRLISLDMVGRGQSGWLMEQSEYTLDTYVEQVCQLLDFLGLEDCIVLGSSLGGSTALRMATLYPERVKGIILNDSGPYIPLERRARRARAVGRFYVFRTPGEMIRRAAAATRPIGPAPDAVRLYNFHHKTRYSEEQGGRIYRHDPRATLAYRADAVNSLNMWNEWHELRCPVLLVHGTESDAMSIETIDEMRKHKEFSVIHVQGAGHTPSLCDYDLTRLVFNWVATLKKFDKDLLMQRRDKYASLIYADA